MALSLLRHVRHSYRPHTAVLSESEDGLWSPLPAAAGRPERPGAGRSSSSAPTSSTPTPAASPRTCAVSSRVRPTPVRWLVVDAGAITSVDYSAARVLRGAARRSGGARHRPGPGASPRPRCRRTSTATASSDVIGRERVFDALHEALAAIREQRLGRVERSDEGTSDEWQKESRDAGRVSSEKQETRSRKQRRKATVFFPLETRPSTLFAFRVCY